MRRVGDDLGHDVADLGKLVHQTYLVVEPACRVDQDYVGARGYGRAQGVVCHRGGVGAHLLTHHGRACTLGPDGQLVYGCGAERVGRAYDHLVACAHELCGQLAYGGGLASAVDADDHHHVGHALLDLDAEVLLRGVRLLHKRCYLVAQDRVQLRSVHVFVACDARLDALYDLDRRLDTYVGGYEHLFELVEHVGIDGRPSRNGAGKFREEAALGLFQTGFQLALLGLLHLLLGSGCRLILFFLEQIEKSHT